MHEFLKWIKNQAISLDQSVNSFFGGDPDETISSRMGKVLHESECVLCKIVPHAVCAFLNLFDPNHCIKSIDPTEGKDDLLR